MTVLQRPLALVAGGVTRGAIFTNGGATMAGWMENLGSCFLISPGIKGGRQMGFSRSSIWEGRTKRLIA